MSTAPLRETDSMARHSRIGKWGTGNPACPDRQDCLSSTERGFTLAAVLVIMSIMLIFIAYTVPRMWSAVLRRDRELQTIFIMQQYAKAINAFQAKNHIYPISVAQLTDARQPRFLRCPKDGCLDPLTGQVDWFIIPQGQAPAAGGGAAPPGAVPQGSGPSGQTATTTAPPGIPIKDYAGGPFVGIRPNKNGNSMIILNGADHYEQWSYTAIDYQTERALRLQAAQKIWQ